MRIFLQALIVFISTTALVPAAFAEHHHDGEGRKDVWFDVDTATGIGEIDDGLMLIQGFHSPEINLRGVSTVYGNTIHRYAYPLTHNIVTAFGPEGMTVHPGAASADELGQDNDAVRAMAAALREAPMTILAVGPVTNVGTLVELYPQLHDRITSIVVVAGRRPGQRFVTTEQSKKTAPRDFNFELDVPAMQAILDTKIPVVLAPWEVSSKVWVTREDISALRTTGETGAFLFATSQHWIDRWEAMRGIAAFNPYDSLALAWITHPQLIEAMRVDVAIETGPDERATAEEQAAGKTKPYLHVRESATPRREAIYCHTPDDRFKAVLLERLAGPASR